MAKSESFEKFINRYRRQRHLGWGLVKGFLTVALVMGIFIGCVYITTQQEGLMPGGTIPGKATGQ